MAFNRFVPLYSTQSGAVPTASALVEGELAINIADGKLYTRSGSNIVLLAASQLISASFALSANQVSASWASVANTLQAGNKQLLGNLDATNYQITASQFQIPGIDHYIEMGQRNDPAPTPQSGSSTIRVYGRNIL